MKKLDLALKYATAGIPVFPVNQDKSPITHKGYKAATTCTKTIRRWWNKHPDALIGGVTGQFSVVDIDLKKGEEAFLSYHKVHMNRGNGMKVETMSGGIHFYYAPVEGVTRQCNALFGVDYLCSKGYVILPDGNDYQAVGGIDRLLNGELPEIPKKLHSILTGDPLEKEEYEDDDIPPIGDDEDDVDEKAVVKEKDRIKHLDLYEVSENFEVGEFHYHPDNPPVKVMPGSLTTKDMNAMFYNRNVQIKLAASLGVKLPEEDTKRSKAFRSVLPGHYDKKPSMGARWARSSQHQHLIVRDFSDHYSNGKIDYNLVRLYASIQKKKPVALSNAEFYVWFMKMLVENEIIEIEEQPIPRHPEKLFTENEQKVVDAFFMLKSIKQCYKDGEDETTFANKFASAWCKVPVTTVGRVKRKMEAFGLIVRSGEHGEGFFATPLFKVGEGKVNRKLVDGKNELNMAIDQERWFKTKSNVQKPKSLLGVLNENRRQKHAHGVSVRNGHRPASEENHSKLLSGLRYRARSRPKLSKRSSSGNHGVRRKRPDRSDENIQRPDIDKRISTDN